MARFCLSSTRRTAEGVLSACSDVGIPASQAFLGAAEAALPGKQVTELASRGGSRVAAGGRDN